MLNTDKLSDLTPTLIPRSRLYHLEPMGLGTFYVESLTSYIERLASAHNVTARNLLLFEIAPLVKQHSISKLIRNSFCVNHFFKKHLNGMSKKASSYVHALEALTLCKDLYFLTMLPWVEITDIRGSFRSNSAWCPACYEEWRLAKKVIYEPLIWSFSPVEICPFHHQPLVFQCPSCNRASALITAYSEPGYCYSCRAWLGRELISINTFKLEISELERQESIVANIGEILAVAPSLASLPSRERIAKIFSIYADLLQGNIAELTRILKISRDNICTWITGESLPTINSLLQICNSLNISLLSFLTSELTSPHLQQVIQKSLDQKPLDCAIKKSRIQKKLLTLEQKLQVLEDALHEFPPPSVLAVAKRHGYTTEVGLRKPQTLDSFSKVVTRHTSYKRIQRLGEQQTALEKLLESEEYPPLSLQGAAKQIGITSPTLRTNFPILCCAISERYSIYREMLGIRRMIQSKRQIFLIFTKIHKENLPPTNLRISSYLDSPVMMKRSEISAAIKEARRRFGYDS